jgi:hypothetical protein
MEKAWRANSTELDGTEGRAGIATSASRLRGVVGTRAIDGDLCRLMPETNDDDRHFLERSTTKALSTESSPSSRNSHGFCPGNPGEGGPAGMGKKMLTRPLFIL